jgi:hypothetical protein
MARLERGHTDPSYRRVEELVRACGFELRATLAPVDDSDWNLAEENLTFGVDDRVRRHQSVLRFAREGRAAMERRNAGA